MFSGFTATNFERLGGFYDYLFKEDVPDGFACALGNVRFKPGSAESRPGIGSGAWSKPGHTFFALSQFIDNLGDITNLTLDESADLDKQNGTGVTGLYSGLALPGSRLSSTTLFNRQYLAFFQPGVLPGGSLVSLDSLGNIDPVSPYGPATKDHLGSTGQITAGSPTITNVTEIQTWCVGDLIGDSQNAIVGPTNPRTIASVIAVDYIANTLTLNQNAVNTSNLGLDGLSAVLFYPLLFVRDDVLPGAIVLASISPDGTGYTPGDVLDIEGGAYGPILTSQVNDEGSGYSVGSTFTVNNPITGAVLATGVVTALDAPSRVLTYTLTGNGSLYQTGTGIATTTTSGGGAGLTIDILSITPGASGQNGTITVNTVNGSGGILTYTADYSDTYNYFLGTFALSGGTGSGAELNVYQVANSAYSSGNIAQGLHVVVVALQARSGYYTEPCARVYWQCAGNRQVKIDYENVNFTLVGSLNPVYNALLFLFSQADDLSLYQIPSSIVGLNTSTYTFNFYDTDLTGGDVQDNLYDNERLSDQAGATQYNSRLVTWGGLALLNIGGMDFLDLVTNGGSTFTVPCGWNPGTNNHAGLQALGAIAQQTPGARPAVRFLGDGVTAVRGEIWQSEISVVIQPLISYTIRVWLRKSAGLTQGSIRFNLIGTGIGPGAVGSTAGFSIDAATLTTSWVQYTGTICLATDVPYSTGTQSVTPDLRLRVALEGTATNAQGIDVSRAQIYQTQQPYDASIVRFSDPFNADRFDAISGYQQITKDDGQRVTSCEQLRWYFYIEKQRSMHVTFDDGQNPPSLWTSNLVDSVAGAASPNATVATESFVLTVARPGAYLFFGGKPIKISQEIQTTWDSINWLYAHTIHIALDPQLHVVYICVPINGATVPNVILILDYTEGFGQEDEPGGRKWGYDTFPAGLNIYTSLIGEQTNAEQGTWFAGTSVASAGTGKVYLLGQQGDLDDGQAVASFYETSYARATPNGTSQFGGVAFTVAGNGTLNVSLLPLGAQAGSTQEQILKPQTMQKPLNRDIEVYADLESERARARFACNRIENDGTCDYFQVRRVGIYAMPWAPQRVY